jgi:hypothetical protein
MRARFFDGYANSTEIPVAGGNLSFGGNELSIPLTSGQAAIRLYSAAPARFDLGSHVIPTTAAAPLQGSPYTTTVRVATPPVLVPLARPVVRPVDITVKQWVDERSYLRTRTNPYAGWTNGANSSNDWMEARARDLVSEASNDHAPEANEVFSRVQSVKDGWAISPMAGQVDFRDPGSVFLNPEYWYIRVGTASVTPSSSDYHGLRRTRPRNRLFSNIVSHEARHSWQAQLRSNGYTDVDHDFLPLPPPSGSPELGDSPYPANPEFNLLGDIAVSTSNDFSLNPAAASEAIEHNADRFAAANTVGTTLSCSPNYLLTAALSSPDIILVTSTYSAGIETPTPAPLTGRTVVFEKDTGDVSRPCDSGVDWQLVGTASTSAGGTTALTLASPTSGRYRVRLINPPECPTEIRQCVSVP